MEQKVIRPYHLFSHQDKWCIINIEGMFASTIDEALVRILKMLTAEPTMQLEPYLEEQLKKLGLLAARGGTNPNNKKRNNKSTLSYYQHESFLDPVLQSKLRLLLW